LKNKEVDNSKISRNNKL